MTPSTCSSCGLDCAVGLQHAVRLGRRIVQWRECVRCHLRIEREAATEREAVRAAQAAEEA